MSPEPKLERKELRQQVLDQDERLAALSDENRTPQRNSDHVADLLEDAQAKYVMAEPHHQSKETNWFSERGGLIRQSESRQHKLAQMSE